MNQIILSGRITKDPELKKTNNTNASYCQFSIAVRNDYKNNDGSYDSIFVDCSVFNGTADYLSRYVKKGDMLLIKGKLSVQVYQDKENKTRTYTSVIVESVENMTPRQQTQENNANTQKPNTNPPQQNQPQQNSFGLDDSDDTLPWL